MFFGISYYDFEIVADHAFGFRFDRKKIESQNRLWRIQMLLVHSVIFTDCAKCKKCRGVPVLTIFLDYLVRQALILFADGQKGVGSRTIKAYGQERLSIESKIYCQPAK